MKAEHVVHLTMLSNIDQNLCWFVELPGNSEIVSVVRRLTWLFGEMLAECTS